MITIAIINLKGGVGKSVTTCNLAAELAAAHKSVLVVDLDKQANTTKFYEALDYEMASVADVLTGDYKANEVICKTSDLEIGLLPANMNLLKANRQILLDTTEPQQVRLREALYPLADDWDFALLDCPPDLDMGSINALCAADYAIVPVDCDEWAVDGLREILDQMDRIRMYYNPRLQMMGGADHQVPAHPLCQADGGGTVLLGGAAADHGDPVFHRGQGGQERPPAAAQLQPGQQTG